VTEEARIRSAITQVAADWYAAHRVGQPSDADRAAFLAWLKASPLHMEEYLGVAALDRSMAAATQETGLSKETLIELARADLGAIPLDHGATAHRQPPPSRPPEVRPWRPALAAAGIAILASGAGFLAWRSSDHATPVDVRTYRTGHGEQSARPLADGSMLRMNTDTLVTVRFSPLERTIELDHGQVAIHVVHDERRALHVRAGSTDTVAIGTDFDVYRRTDSTLITVVSGQVSVSVDSPVPPQRLAQVPAKPPSKRRVGAAQQLEVVADVPAPEPRPADLRETTAWLERKVVFEERPLAAVAEEFNRYNDIVFAIDDPTLRNLKISGNFDAADIASFAAFLGSLGGVHVERLPASFRVSRVRTKPTTVPRRS
jgi:transmembrane sensor